MTDLMIVGIALLGFAIVGGSIVLSARIRANGEADRDRIEERFADRYNKKCRESDSWRHMYEIERVRNVQLESRLEIQDLVYGKVKVKDMKGAKAS